MRRSIVEWKVASPLRRVRVIDLDVELMRCCADKEAAFMGVCFGATGLILGNKCLVGRLLMLCAPLCVVQTIMWFNVGHPPDPS